MGRNRRLRLFRSPFRLRRRAATLLVALISATTLLLIFAWPGGCGHHTPPSAPLSPAAPILRVRIMQDQSQVKLIAAQPPAVRVGDGAPQTLNVPANTTVAITLKSDGWYVGAVNLGPGKDLLIEPQPEGSVKLNGVAYRGSYRLVRSGGGEFDVVNHVHVESYLKGVLAREMFPEFHPEAYAAQAIAARTYAIYEHKTAPAGRAWDLQADTRSQMYGGIAGETAKSRQATDLTAGIVLGHGPAGQERIFKAYFSACCGGAGQSSADAFGESFSEPLSDRHVGTQCADPGNKRFTWGPVTVGKDELTRRFRIWGRNRGRAEKDMGRVERIDVFKTNASGRPTHFIVIDARGARYMMVGEELRLATNTDDAGTTLYSSYVTPVADGNAIRFQDCHGFGHGVGLCQWCAESQAKRGVPHERIVTEAYKGSKLIRAY